MPRNMSQELDRYDTFFNPNMCHVCKSKDYGNFQTCDQCYMITYCNSKHRQIDYLHHVQVCVSLQKLLKSHPHFWITVQLNLEEWIQSRKEFIRLIKTELLRDLKPYEVQMIIFAKSCLICHQQVNIYPCQKCWSVNYCSDHADDFKSYHSSSCKELRICLNLELKYCEEMPKVIKFSKFPDKTRRIFNMHSFVEKFVRQGRYVDRRYIWLSADYFYSDYVSAPLTLYYGLQDVNLLHSIVHRSGRSFVIHIIAANHIDREYLSYWELLLHILRKIKDLRIVLIGSELHTECDKITVCSRCSIHYKQSLNFECYNMLYHNYVNSEEYKPPNVIMVFQTDQWNILSEPILKIRDQNCPLFLTAKSKFKSKQNISKIDKILNSSSNIVYSGKNKFSSGKPYRDFETDGVSYRNKYLVIYQNLFKSLAS